MFLRVDVYPAAIFSRLGGIDYAPGEAAVLAAPLLPIALMLLFVERRLLGHRVFTVLGMHGSRERLDLGWRRRPIGLAFAMAALVSALPVLALAWRARHGFSGVTDWLGPGPGNSLITALVAASAIACLGVVLGHALARRVWIARALDGVSLLLFLLPAAVLGVGLISVWNRPATRFVYGTLAIVVLAFVARYAVIGIRTFAASVSQSSPSFEDAARVSGAGFVRRLFGIVVPMHRKGAIAAFLLALVFCLRDLETAVLLYPPGGETLPVRIFTLEANGPESTVAALAVTHIAITLCALGLGSWLLWRRRSG